MLGAAAPPALRGPPTGPDIDWRDARALALTGGGGPIDVRLLTPARGLAAVVGGARPVEGVVVRGVDGPDVTAEPSCLVGDLVGDCRK